MNGVLLVNKEKEYTSRDVVNIISKHLNTKKVGHTGTLDPMAQGVLIICVGKATKIVDVITNEDKEYIAEIILGIKTDTLDITGNVLKEEKIKLSKEEITIALTELIGEYEQQVPIYSAVKIKGKKLYEYARNGEEVELPKRMVNIKKIELIGDTKYINDKTVFKIKCLVSKGTYIRSLIDDIARELNTIGTMSELTRTKQGKISIEECVTIEDVKNDNYSMMDIRKLLPKYKQVVVDEKLEKDILNGKIINNIYDCNVILFVNKEDALLGLYHEYDKDKSKLKPWKMFK